MFYTVLRALISSTDFPGTRQILLELNYRSTGAILKASLGIVTQGKS